ncbi:hypothetical protein Hypma_009415 [Hypsizygus marmoreus]|uniref:Uncharacterized protein n=1 Tax=Hypsizygus marmoreus TaxID=39966 RepID=A0A369JNC7_HYPMA|nr:hypothetical protein Hypma_009415 [Hypsizygus marmoreus]
MLLSAMTEQSGFASKSSLGLRCTPHSACCTRVVVIHNSNGLFRPSDARDVYFKPTPLDRPFVKLLGN